MTEKWEYNLNEEKSTRKKVELTKSGGKIKMLKKVPQKHVCYICISKKVRKKIKIQVKCLSFF